MFTEHVINGFTKAWEWLASEHPERCQAPGWRLFQLGLFWMPTSALIGGVLLLLSLTALAPDKQNRPLRHPIALLWLVIAVSLLVTTMLTAAASSTEEILRVFNWIPFFWFFLAAAPYLSSNTSRRRAIIALTAGSVPVAVLSLIQAVLGLSGPWQTAGGLIEWNLPELHKEYGAGVFPNPNFNAAWMALLLPLTTSLALNTQSATTTTKKHRLRFAPAACVSFLFALSIYINSSRSSLIVSSTGLLLLSAKTFIAPISAAIALIGIGVLFTVMGKDASGELEALHQFAEWSTGRLANKIETMVHSNSTTGNLRSDYYPRTIEFIKQHPWLGKSELALGDNSSDMLEKAASIKPAGVAHFHSLPLQVWFDHGLPTLLLLTGLVIWIVYRGWKVHLRNQRSSDMKNRSKKKNNLRLTDRAILISATIAVVIHTFDIPSFESRINLLGWLLLSATWMIGSAPNSTTQQISEPEQI